MTQIRYFVFFYLYTFKDKEKSTITGNGRIHYDSDEGFPSLNEVEQKVAELNSFDSAVVTNWIEMNEKDFMTSQGK